MNCTKCNAENVEGSKFCKVCGNELLGTSNEKFTNKKNKSVLKSIFTVIGVIFGVFFILGIIFGDNKNDASNINSKAAIDTQNNVVFCKSVDKELNTIDEGKSFPVGEVTIKLSTQKKFGADKIKVIIYKIDGTTESIFDSAEEEVNPEWNTLSFPIELNEIGNYRVDFTKNGAEKIGSGEVTIN